MTSAAARLSVLAPSRPPKPAPMITTLALAKTGSSSLMPMLSVGPCMAGCQACGEALAIRATSFCEVRFMATHNLLLLPGDGIGPEVLAELKRVIDLLYITGTERFIHEDTLYGGCCYNKHGIDIHV